MAKKTNAEKITELETKIAALEAELDEQERYSEIEGSGQTGARTKFTSPKILEEMLEKRKNQLENLYLQDTTNG